jgi:stearoyl-CoA desaturase (Delta-9 desaturase)
MGVHRLWSHKSFKAILPLRIVLGIFATIASQRSIKWWATKHRMHHRYSEDWEQDPYCPPRGFFYAHIGWLLHKPYLSYTKYVDTSDLDADIGEYF